MRQAVYFDYWGGWAMAPAKPQMKQKSILPLWVEYLVNDQRRRFSLVRQTSVLFGSAFERSPSLGFLPFY